MADIFLRASAGREAGQGGKSRQENLACSTTESTSKQFEGFQVLISVDFGLMVELSPFTDNIRLEGGKNQKTSILCTKQ